MRIKIIGGGPAGLLFAMLMKKHDPGQDIRRMDPDFARTYERLNQKAAA